MPGIVLFNRRWAVGSDDFVVPGVFNLILHIVWLIILSIILGTVDFGRMSPCVVDLHEHVLGYIVILTGCIVVEACISWVSMRGSILYTEPRASMQYLLYVRLGILLVEIAWLIVGGFWIGNHYSTCPTGVAKEAILGIVVCNWVVMMFVVIAIWCTFDAAGRSWVKMKKYQRSLRDSRTRFYKRSGSTQRNWRHRKAIQEYRDSWNKRCRLLFCCMNKSDQDRNSFGEIAKLLSEFFRDLDVVPSDVVAGLVLLRKYQKLERESIIEQKSGIFQFLSGVAITEQSRFLDINNENVVRDFRAVIHHMRYAVAAYGWPMYMVMHPMSALCTICCKLGCCCLPVRKAYTRDTQSIVHDNCCHCNYVALKRICCNYDMDIVFGTYHVEIGETPFFVAVDHEMKNVVVSIRGTLSLQDVVTDLNAEAEPIPTEPVQEAWYGHKGMIQAAEYIRRKLINDQLLARAFNYSIERGTIDYQLVLVGHSLGAGTAAILAILLRNEYPNLHCYSFSPPGGLLSLPLVEYTKSFITSVVVGKDLVPRIGLHQMEQLRSDLINAIKKSCDPKWKVIASGVMCCCTEATLGQNDDNDIVRDASTHPSDSSIALTVHQPLYPPGRIIHIVRSHPSQRMGMFRRNEPIYQALWADSTDFDQVLISPVMIQDHMPDKVLEALEKVLVNTGPPKPQRHYPMSNNLKIPTYAGDSVLNSPDHSPSGRLIFETSFTDWNPEPHRPTTLQRNSENMNFVYSVPDSNNQPVPVSVSYINDRNDIFAPLASPETMSDVSSLSSFKSSVRSSCVSSELSSSIDLRQDDKIVWGKYVCEPPKNSVLTNGDENAFSETAVMVEIEPKINSDCTESSSCDQDSVSDPKPNSILKLSKSERKRVTFDLAGDSIHSFPPDGEIYLPTYPTYSTQTEYGKHVYDYNGSLDFNNSPPSEKNQMNGDSNSNNAHVVSSAEFLKMEMPPIVRTTSNETMTNEQGEVNSTACVLELETASGSDKDPSGAGDSIECINILPPESFS